jgi:hypothetical protein
MTNTLAYFNKCSNMVVASGLNQKYKPREAVQKRQTHQLIIAKTKIHLISVSK